MISCCHHWKKQFTWSKQEFQIYFSRRLLPIFYRWKIEKLLRDDDDEQRRDDGKDAFRSFYSDGMKKKQTFFDLTPLEGSEIEWKSCEFNFPTIGRYQVIGWWFILQTIQHNEVFQQQELQGGKNRLESWFDYSREVFGKSLFFHYGELQSNSTKEQLTINPSVMCRRWRRHDPWEFNFHTTFDNEIGHLLNFPSSFTRLFDVHTENGGEMKGRKTMNFPLNRVHVAVWLNNGMEFFNFHEWEMS